jgi:virulence-associated protein VagC
MGEINTATVFDHNGSLAVDLPEGFHVPDGKVRIIREGNFIRIEPDQPVPDPNLPNPEAERTLAELRKTVRRIRAEAAANPKPLPTIGRKQTDEEIVAMFARIYELTGGTFMSEGREQPPMPDDDENSFDLYSCSTQTL